MLEAAVTSETSVNVYQTARFYITEDSHLCAYRCENLKLVQDFSEHVFN